MNMASNFQAISEYERGFRAGNSAGRLSSAESRNEQRAEYANMHARVMHQRRELDTLLRVLEKNTEELEHLRKKLADYQSAVATHLHVSMNDALSSKPVIDSAGLPWKVSHEVRVVNCNGRQIAASYWEMDNEQDCYQARDAATAIVAFANAYPNSVVDKRIAYAAREWKSVYDSCYESGAFEDAPKLVAADKALYAAIEGK
jgi:hypothetical protein